MIATIASRGEAQNFDYGLPLEKLFAQCLAETGLEPPTPAKPLRGSPLEPGEDALARVRAGDGMCVKVVDLVVRNLAVDPCSDRQR